jgi:hypothetical protein
MISPVLVSISDDQSEFSGQNLVFEKIRVGPTGADRAINCTSAIGCFVPSGFTSEDGFLFFVTPTGRVPFMILTDKGLQPVPAHHPKATPAGRGGNAGGGATAPQGSNSAPLTDTQHTRPSLEGAFKMFAVK